MAIQSKMISIIVPMHNVEKYIERCVRSIMEQSYRNIEIILVDDDSDDESYAIAKELAQIDDRIIVVHQKKTGVSGARNNGLTYANGQFVMFVDGDDWIDKDICKKAIDVAFEKNADFVFWSYIREYENSSLPTDVIANSKSIDWDQKNITQLYRRFVGEYREELKEPQKIDVLSPVWGKLYRKECLKDIFFEDTKIIGNEDALFNIQVISNVVKAVFIPEYAYHYRKTNEFSLTRNYKNKLVNQWEVLYSRIIEHLKHTDVSPDFYEALNNRIALGLIGLGLNLIEDSKMSMLEKIQEMGLILNKPHYKIALHNLKIRYMPTVWKVFFCLARYRQTVMVCLLLKTMNYLRSK